MFRGGEAKSSALLGGQARHSAISIACRLHSIVYCLLFTVHCSLSSGGHANGRLWSEVLEHRRVQEQIRHGLEVNGYNRKPPV